jgi:hypothetical protein
MLYAVAGEDGRRSWMVGFVVACVAGAQVLLSAPLFGTAWAGPFAAVIPVAAGLLSGGGSLAWRRARFLRRRGALARTLAALGEHAERPTARGLGAYYDAQLVLLRSEYEYIVARRGGRTTTSAGLLEEAFGFAPEDGFECGPLSVVPDSGEMDSLRGRWEARLALRRSGGHDVPAMSLKEDRAYRVFPREMTVPMELATRKAYLSISCRLLRERYGRDQGALPEDVRRRARRDLQEYATLARRA